MSDELKAAMEWLRSVVYPGWTVGERHAAVLLAHLDGEPGRLAAAREEQHRADLDAAKRAVTGACSVCQANVALAVDSTLGGIAPLKTPLADEIRALRADLDVAESRKSQAIHDLHARAEKAEARVLELEAESSTWAKACGEEMRKRQSMEANWENMAANNREFCARAEKAEARVAKLEATIDDIYNGKHGWECTDCGRPTANGKCTECRRGISPWKKLEAERDFLRAKVERVRIMAEEVLSKTYLDPWDVLDALEGK